MGWTADTFFQSLFLDYPKTYLKQKLLAQLAVEASVLLGHLLNLMITSVIVSSGVKT